MGRTYDPVVDGMFRAMPEPWEHWAILHKWGGRLTKAQQREVLRIVHWFYGRPFRARARDKAEVPQMTREEVLERFIGRDVSGAGMYWTPIGVAEDVVGYLNPTPDMRILEPAAGVGHLLYAMEAYGVAEVVAYDICNTNVALGARLFPWAAWRWGTPFEELDSLRGQFDAVVMNPPFGTRRGMYAAEQWSRWGAKRSEHLFLELALECVRPGGQVVMIGPATFLYNMPRRVRHGLDERAVVELEMPLAAQFALTGVRTGLFIFRLQEELQPMLF